MSETNRTQALPDDILSGTLRGRPRQLLRAVLYPLLWLVIGLRLKHVERVPADGPVLVVSNHLHNADPILVEVAMPRAMHYMAKKELFAVPVISWLLRRIGCFPVDRGKADRGAIRRAEATLARGIALGMFPEGTRSATRGLQTPQSGAGMLALRANVPVVPAIVTGTERLPFNGKRGREQAKIPMPKPGHRGVQILFGEPFCVPREIDGRRVTSEAAADLIMTEIARLLPPDYRGIYAERLAQETHRRVTPWPGGSGSPADAPMRSGPRPRSE